MPRRQLGDVMKESAEAGVTSFVPYGKNRSAGPASYDIIVLDGIDAESPSSAVQSL